MRIEQHPILGEFEKGPKVQFTFDGKTNEPRGMFCAIGRCTDCIMVVNGMPNIRTCVEPLKAGMVVQTQKGKGPEGSSE
jgi:hypothetical protein